MRYEVTIKLVKDIDEDAGHSIDRFVKALEYMLEDSYRSERVETNYRKETT